MEDWEQLSSLLLAPGLMEVTIKLSIRAAGIWRLDRGRRNFQDGSLVAVTGVSFPCHVNLSTGLLYCPCNMTSELRKRTRSHRAFYVLILRIYTHFCHLLIDSPAHAQGIGSWVSALEGGSFRKLVALFLNHRSKYLPLLLKLHL